LNSVNPVLTIAAAFAITVGVRGEEFQWNEATPASQGMSAQKLENLKDVLIQRRTKALLVIRNDKIVCEWYSDNHGPDKQHYTASMAKALVGGVPLAVAISDGRIALHDSAAKYIPQWANDPEKSKITIRQLGSHTSGMEDAEADGLPHSQLLGWQGDFWKQIDPPHDPFSISRDKTPLLAKPGAKFQYSNPGIAMLGYAVTAALKDAPEKDLRTLLRDRIMRPIGVPDEAWSCGYGRTFLVDGLPLVDAWGGGGYTARATARVARLMLRKGNWEGEQLIDAKAVRQTTSDAGTPSNGGMGWWTNSNGDLGKAPQDAFSGQGAGHQIVFVVPSLNLIAVRNGDLLDPIADGRAALRQYLFNPLIGAITNAPHVTERDNLPYPRSRVIGGVKWAPKETIVRKGKDGDNWPLTWADDDDLYTAYGDGWGFEPRVEKKLSLGVAKIVGGSHDFQGINIRSESGEQVGQGEAGKKASGMLMVDGVLYMWVRNAGNSQLAWSADHGASWQWADWKFTTGFGAPTFLNFGKNYTGARDEYVYVYSHDSDSAYEPADRMVLARVPKSQITSRDAYEFFRRTGYKGKPVWTRQIGQRGAVFLHAARCYRSGISYNAPLKRYLWCQIHPPQEGARGPRFEGGFGIYDAPEPWGPWTTTYFTENWDVGPGETSSLPTKWMSEDGKTVHLVFSGDDHFSVRKATLTIE